jgi:KUP system potassium uptake protein
MLAALGIVYGDIGTSPLYAVRQCFRGPHGFAVTPENVLGILSLVVWALVLVISVKYLLFVMRADNHGEGGILALTALVGRTAARRRTERRVLVVLGLCGAALLYGDGMITPAISVLSAVEGLQVTTPVFQPYAVPLTVVILIGLFLLQKRGTSAVGALFGPVMLLWFGIIGTLGVVAMARQPAIIAALDPTHAAAFFGRHRWHGVAVLGAVFLVVTGGEALYADLGHFGPKPIRRAWFGLVLPALLCNYLGQGALLLSRPGAVDSPFFRLVPGWGMYPMVGLSTAATVIASQAVISGTFSLTRQAVQLGYCPRLSIQHTSPESIGQIYVPFVNWVLLAATVGLVAGFRSSSGLAAAYGMAVSTTMIITTVLASVVARERWHWPLAWTLASAALWFAIDTAFLGANLLKVAHGGWFPLVVAGAVYATFATWKRGRRLVAGRLRRSTMSVQAFLDLIHETPPARVAGTAVFLADGARRIPKALVRHLSFDKVLHERLVLLSVTIEDRPHVPPEDRVDVEEIEEGLTEMIGHYGFMDTPDAGDLMRRVADDEDLPIDPKELTFYLGTEVPIVSPRRGMPRVFEQLFVFLSRIEQRAIDYYRIPGDRVVELGVRVEI